MFHQDILTRCFAILLLFAFVDVTSVYGHSPKRPEAVTINKFQLDGSLYPGDTANVVVEYTAHHNGSGEFRLDFPKDVAPLDRQPGETFRVFQVQLDSGQVYYDTVPVKVFSPGAAHIAVSAHTTDAPENFLVGNSRFANVESSPTDYKLIYDNDNFATPFTESTGPVGLPIAPVTKRIEIHGSVSYIDGDQFWARRGAYDTRVNVWLRSEQSRLWHPIPKWPAPLQHVHYDVCDVNGNFEFDFEFEAHDLAGYEIVVLVEKSNSAVAITSGGGEYIIDAGFSGEIRTFGTAEGIVLPLTFGTYHYYEDVDITINPLDGAIMRNAILAHEFVIMRHSGTLPFSLPTIEVVRKSLTDAAGIFRCRVSIPNLNEHHWIEIDHQATNSDVVAHEYGHYVNFQMWGGDCPELSNTPRQTKEGFAIFFSFASRNYANNVYGDRLLWSWDNTESAPFETNPRFDNIGYTATNPDYSQFACYLWGLYDSYTDGNFMGLTFDGSNNDDVSGQGLRVFDILRNNSGTSAAHYHSQFKSGLDGELQASVNDIYDCMFIGPANLMRPAQVRNGSWSTSGNGLTLSWDVQTYGPPDQQWGNYETGYVVYRYENDDWLQIGAPPRGTTSFTVSPAVYGLYKVTAQNGSGESYNPIYISQIDKRPNGEYAFNEHECKFLSVSPNPARGDHVTFEYYLSDSRNVAITIVDAAGRQIVSAIHTEREKGFHNNAFDVSNLQSGAYFARLDAIDANGRVYQATLPFTVVR